MYQPKNSDYPLLICLMNGLFAGPLEWGSSILNTLRLPPAPTIWAAKKPLQFNTHFSIIIFAAISGIYLGVAQFGSVLEWGSRGRRFKSSHPDQIKKMYLIGTSFLFGLA